MKKTILLGAFTLFLAVSAFSQEKSQSAKLKETKVLKLEKKEGEASEEKQTKLEKKAEMKVVNRIRVEAIESKQIEKTTPL